MGKIAIEFQNISKQVCDWEVVGAGTLSVI